MTKEQRRQFAAKEYFDFNDLQTVMKELRAKDGCPWDSVQTHESIKNCLKDECEEVIQAIDNKDMENLKEELGDLLFQVIMHSEIASEEGDFDINDVVDGICKKMIFRHPRLFGDTEHENTSWAELKRLEKLKNNGNGKHNSHDE